MKNARLAALLTLPLFMFTGCVELGLGETGEFAEDVPAPSDTPEPERIPIPENPEPGTLPDFAPQNYTYIFGAGCCRSAIQQIEVVVSNGEVVSAEYVGRRITSGRSASSLNTSTEVPAQFRVSIQDMIDEANAAQGSLQVDWPEDQDWPNSIYIDKNERIADEEVTYQIHMVNITD